MPIGPATQGDLVNLGINLIKWRNAIAIKRWYVVHSLVIKVKRVYDPVESDDGVRVLVDRLWPRGLSKEKARVNV